MNTQSGFILQKRYPSLGMSAPLRAKEKSLNANCVQAQSGAGGRTRTGTVSPPVDFELFASHRIQTNSTPYGGRRRTPKSPQLLTILKLMCKKAPFRLPFPYFSILTGILDFGGTSEGCNPKTEHNSTRNRFIKHKHIIACSSAIDNIFFKKEVSL